MSFIFFLLLLIVGLLIIGFVINLVFKLIGTILPNWVKTVIFVAIVIIGVALYVTRAW